MAAIGTIAIPNQGATPRKILAMLLAVVALSAGSGSWRLRHPLGGRRRPRWIIAGLQGQPPYS